MALPALLTSRANPRFKALRDLLGSSGTKRTHTLLLGSKLLETWHDVSETEAGSRFHPTLWFRLEGARPHPLEPRLGLETLILGESLMRDLADAGSPPDHALLGEIGPDPATPLRERVILPWGLQDPGNLGAVLRSAAAFGFDEAVLGPGCADPFSPKALRGSMGAAFLMPLRRASHLSIDPGHWWALHGGEHSVPLQEANLEAPLRILVGNEGHGWKGSDLPAGVRFLSIPTQGVESLNAAVAAGIACFETARRASL